MDRQAALIVAVLCLVLSGFLLYWFHPVPRRRRRIRSLERRYLASQPGLPHEARARLDRQLTRLREQFPERGEIWIRERLIADEERARR